MSYICLSIPGPVRYSMGLLLLLSGPLCAQEIRYVSDQITLKMYKDIALGKTLPPLRSGDRVQVLKQDDGYAEVQLADGTKGWVRSSYLVSDKPAVVAIGEVREELDSMKSKYENLLLEKTMPVTVDSPELVQRVEDAEAVRDNLQRRVTELETANTRRVEELRDLRNTQAVKQYEQHRNRLLWAIVLLLSLFVGFFGGRKYLEAKIKARFGGYNPL